MTWWVWGVWDVYSLRTDQFRSHWRWVRALQGWAWQISSTADWARATTVTVQLAGLSNLGITGILRTRRLRCSVGRNSLLVTSDPDRRKANKWFGPSPPSERLSTTSWTSRSLSLELYYIPDLVVRSLMKAWEPTWGARILQLSEGRTGRSSTQRIIISDPPRLTPSGQRSR